MTLNGLLEHMKFSVFGIDFSVNPLFFPLLTFMLLADKSGVALPVVLAMMIHESGHIFAMVLFKKRIQKIEMMPSALLIKGEASYSFCEDFAIASAGIVFNVLFCAFFVALNKIFSADFLLFAAANIALGALNLLPIHGLDGGKILMGFLCNFFKNYDKIFKIISAAFSIFFAAAFLWCIYKGVFNITALFFIVYIFAVLLIKV